MKRILRRFLGCSLFTGALFCAAVTEARCVTPVPTDECVPLSGVKTLGLLVEIREGVSALGISKTRLMKAVQRMVRGLMPQVQTHPDPGRTPQIRIVASRLRHKGSFASIYLRVEVRAIDLGTQSLAWKSVWHTSHVIPAPAGIGLSALEDSLRVSLTRLRADWRRANPGRASRTGPAGR